MENNSIFVKKNICCVMIKSVEIKSSTTINTEFFKGLNYYRKLNENSLPFLVYGGAENMKRKEAEVFKWNDTKKLLDIL